VSTIDTLSQFVAQLEQAGELVRVRQPVSLNLELCEIADRVMKQEGGGKALLFEQPVLMNGQRSAFPVGINLFGSMRRMSMSLGVESLDEIGARIDEMLAMKVPEGIIAKLALLPRLLEMGKFPPRTKKGGVASQEIVWRDAEVDLDRLPLMKCWPEDGGAYITFPMVITRDPK
jgi:4-hydroxy-3-polyprenylbenzoate decarboxylase